MRALGVDPAVVDVFDQGALSRAVQIARPEMVIHQLTDLPSGLAPGRMAEAIVGNARIRDEGTHNLVKAAIQAGGTRLVAQGIAWAYAAGPEPHPESDPLDVDAEGDRAVSIRGVAALERCTLHSPPLVGIVLRYGRLYGEGTGVDRSASPALHVDAAAQAALLAIDYGEPGIFNIAEPSNEITPEKARADLGWRADFRLPS